MAQVYSILSGFYENDKPMLAEDLIDYAMAKAKKANNQHVEAYREATRLVLQNTRINNETKPQMIQRIIDQCFSRK